MFKEQNPSRLEQAAVRQNGYGIDVQGYIDAYGLQDLRKELEHYPALCYLLGGVGPAVDMVTGERVRDSRPDKIDRPIWYLIEGSGMFGLRNPEDAMRWKGIFNHIMGSARYVEFVTQTVKTLPTEQRQMFTNRGYDFSFFDALDPNVLRDFMFTSHLPRRSVDERDWQNIHDAAHPTGKFGDVRDSGELAERKLKELGAPQEFLDLIKVEQHIDELMKLQKGGKFVDIRFAIMTYCDWIYNQRLVTLDDRFTQLRQSGRETEEVLAVLQQAGKQFEKDLFEITGLQWEHIQEAQIPAWEYEIRSAYAKSAGLSLKDVYPDFTDQWEKQHQGNS